MSLEKGTNDNHFKKPQCYCCIVGYSDISIYLKLEYVNLRLRMENSSEIVYLFTNVLFSPERYTWIFVFGENFSSGIKILLDSEEVCSFLKLMAGIYDKAYLKEKEKKEKLFNFFYKNQSEYNKRQKFNRKIEHS